MTFQDVWHFQATVTSFMINFEILHYHLGRDLS